MKLEDRHFTYRFDLFSWKVMKNQINDWRLCILNKLYQAGLC